MAEAQEIGIIVNGEQQRVPVGATVAQLLEMMEIAGDRVAVEVDREIVKRALWEATALKEGARVEIVQFVGGG